MNSIFYELQYHVLYFVEATSKDDPDLYGKVILSYTETRELTWRHDLTVEVGVSVGFTVDIPFVGETSVDVSVKVAKTESRETKATSSVTKTREAASTMKPKKKVASMLRVKRGFTKFPGPARLSTRTWTAARGKNPLEVSTVMYR